MIGGESLRGASGNAADLGLMPVPPSRLASAPVPDRRWDILLSRASLNALARHLRHHGIAGARPRRPRGLRRSRPAPRCANGSTTASTRWCPRSRASLAVLDLPAVVIDCDIDSGLIDELMKRVDARPARHRAGGRQTPRILRGTFRADAGAIGAASLPMFFNFSPRADVLRGRRAPANQETANAVTPPPRCSRLRKISKTFPGVKALQDVR